MNDFETVLADHVAQLDELTDTGVEAIRAAQASATLRMGSAFPQAFNGGRRALVAGQHGAALAAADEAARGARPDLPQDVRVAFRWAVLAEAFRGELTDAQHEALTLAWSAGVSPARAA